MRQFLQSPWLAVAVGILAYGSATFAFLQPRTLVRQREGASGAGLKQLAGLQPSWAFKNPELDQALNELREERDALRLRAQQLNDLQARLEAERQEILAVTQTVARLQAELEKEIVRLNQNVIRLKEEEAANLKKLAKTYLAMTPDGAAKVMKEMDDEQVLRLLLFMKESEKAPILELLAQGGSAQAKRVAILSDRLRVASLTNLTEKPKP